MPVTIRELVIRTLITEPEERAQSMGEEGSSLTAEQREELIQECVSQVMDRLREQNGR